MRPYNRNDDAVPHGAGGARDLKGHICDFMHFDTKAQEKIGVRYAELHLKLIKK